MLKQFYVFQGFVKKYCRLVFFCKVSDFLKGFEVFQMFLMISEYLKGVVVFPFFKDFFVF